MLKVTDCVLCYEENGSENFLHSRKIELNAEKRLIYLGRKDDLSERIKNGYFSSRWFSTTFFIILFIILYYFNFSITIS